MIPASRPEGAKGMEERVGNVLAHRLAGLSSVSLARLTDEIAALCAEYAREQVEATLTEGVKQVCFVLEHNDLRAQLAACQEALDESEEVCGRRVDEIQTLEARERALVDTLPHIVLEMFTGASIDLHALLESPCPTCALAPRRG